MFNIKPSLIFFFLSLLILFIPFQFYIALDFKHSISIFLKLEIALILMCIPIILYYKYFNNKFEAPLIPFFCIYFIISYILPFGFFDEEIFNSYINLCLDDRLVVPTGIRPENVKVCDAGAENFIIKLTEKLLLVSISFIVGYFFSLKIFSSINLKTNFFEIEKNSKIKVLSWSMFALIFIKKFIFVGHVPFLTQATIPFSYLLSGLCIYIFAKDNERFKFIYLFPILIIIFKDLLDGYMSFPILLSFFSFTLYCIFKKKIPIFFIIALFILVNIGHFFKYEYRKNLKELKNSSNIEKILTLKNSVFNSTQSKFFEDEIQNNLQRIAHPLHSMALITKKTPDYIPYWDGYTYKILITKLIPRFFWRDKPSDIIGNQVGKRYKVLNHYDQATSWNLPVINEFYVNFGIKGLIIGTFLLSVFMCFISKIFRSSNNHYMMTIISVYVTFKFFFLESHLSMIFGNFIQNLVLLAIPFLIINFKKFKDVKNIISNN